MPIVCSQLALLSLACLSEKSVFCSGFADYYAALPQISWLVHANGEIWKQKENDREYVAIIHQDHFK